MDFWSQVWKRVWEMALFGLKLGLDLEMRAAHPHQKFQGVPTPGKSPNKIFSSIHKKSWARIESIKCYPCEQLEKSITFGSCFVGRLFKLWRKYGARPDKWIFTLNFKTTVNHWWSVFTFVEHNNNITIQAGFDKAILFVLSFIFEMSDRSTYKSGNIHTWLRTCNQ